MDAVRMQTERCDSLQGFQIMSSLGGGTGSGMGCLLISRIKEEYSDSMLHTYSIFPSNKVSDVAIEPYNAILSTYQFINNTHQVLVFDNEALYDISFRTLKLAHPTYREMNNLITDTISGLTCTLRFPLGLNSTMRKMSMNLVSFPRLQFIMSSLSPLIRQKRDLSVPELYQQIFDAKNFLTSADPRHGRVLSGVTIYRGNVSEKEVDEQSLNVANKNSSYYVEWIPNNLKTCTCKTSLSEDKICAGSALNSTAIQEVFRKLEESFNCLYRRKAFLHWYIDAGLEEQEFLEAEASLKDLISEYQYYQDTSAEYDNEEIIDEP